MDIFPKKTYQWATGTQKEALNITNHQGNAEQNHREIPPETC